MKVYIIAAITTLLLLYASFRTTMNQSTIKKAKADGAKINIIMNPKIGTVSTDGQTINLIIQPEETVNTISGIHLTLKATGALSIVEMAKPETFPGGDSSIFSQIQKDVSADRARISYVVSLPDDKLPKAVKIQVKIAGYAAGAGTLYVDSGSLQIVGVVPGYKYEPGTIDSAELIFSENGVKKNLPKQEAKRNGKNITLKIKMQGVSDRPLYQNTIVPVKVTLIHPTTHIEYEYQIPVISTGQGIWSGTVPIDAPAGSGYTLLIKGGLHLQKKMQGTFSITDADNIIDLSNVVLSAGDIQGEHNTQDGVIDSLDISYIRSHFGESAAENIETADLNFDGVVDSQDYSLLMSSLKFKVDEQ